MERPKVNLSSPTIGIDLGDNFSHYCVLKPEAEVIEAGQLKTTREALTARFVTMSPVRVAMENGYAFGVGQSVAGELRPRSDRGSRP